MNQTDIYCIILLIILSAIMLILVLIMKWYEEREKNRKTADQIINDAKLGDIVFMWEARHPLFRHLMTFSAIYSGVVSIIIIISKFRLDVILSSILISLFAAVPILIQYWKPNTYFFTRDGLYIKGRWIDGNLKLFSWDELSWVKVEEDGFTYYKKTNADLEPKKKHLSKCRITCGHNTQTVIGIISSRGISTEPPPE